MGNLVFGSAERPGNYSTDAANIPVVSKLRDNDVAIGQGARPTERLEKATAAARHSKTDILNVAIFNYSLHKLREMILHRKCQLI